MTATPLFAGQQALQLFGGKRPQQARAHQADGLACIAQPIHGLPGLGGKGADHDQHDLGILAAVGLDRCMLAPEDVSECSGGLVIHADGIQGGEVALVAEIGIGRAAQHGNGLAGRGAGAEAGALCVIGRQETAGGLPVSGISTGSRVKDR